MSDLNKGWAGTEQFWPQLWLSSPRPADVSDSTLQAAAFLLRQIHKMPLSLAICFAMEVRTRVQDGTFDPQKSSIAVANDRYIVWEDRPGNLDTQTLQRDVQITALPATFVRYNPAGFIGAIHAQPADATQHADPDQTSGPTP